MKKINKKIIILLGIIIIFIALGIFIYFWFFKTEKTLKIEHENSEVFENKYRIKDEKMTNKNNFNYKAEITSKKEEDELVCLNINFYDDNKNILLSYNDYINIKIKQDSGYIINVENDTSLDVSFIEYDICN